MIVHINCTANLGDFSNALPVISGLYKSLNEKITLIIRPEMRKFNGIKEFLKCQPMIKDVNFSDEVFAYGTNVIDMSSWTRLYKVKDRPMETCAYENWVKDRFGIQFEVDDDFQIEVPYREVELTDKVIIGDRWSNKQDPSIDARRNTNVVENGAQPNPDKVIYLDYSKDLLYNCNLIKQSSKPFVTTFTGIGIIADLMNKETIVCWDEDMRVWDGKPVEYDFERHYYTDRKSKLVHVKDLEKENGLFA